MTALLPELLPAPLTRYGLPENLPHPKSESSVKLIVKT